MAERTLLGIVGSVSADSRTRTAVEVALDAAADTHDVDTAVLHLADYDLATADGRGIGNHEGDTADALELIVEADAYVVGTPVYRGSYSGALKNLFDMVPRGEWQGDVAPFENAAVGLVATGATDHHFLAVDQELRPAFAFFGAHTVGGATYASGDDFADGELVDGGVGDRLATLGEATVELAAAIDDGDALGSLGPAV
ncbi:NADPH-dependent FMN reductase [Halorubrum sp. Ib24]|uniref:NADPH-dependent FMN reductase n=1 Tax=unclassified Halorubrum TaxID=2642239 RepID=UPI000B998DFB|nr:MULTISPECIES: NAD(P)H-dependent oxidoreductase [unclassified Halorubrum]OYR38983.1 NADPH-dependent FMN reductase [Halorubrum sp. Ib24]OYR42056.1 NADPH-dependent FMN reductase [Halorubrum sp. Eb13]OYR51049.1 NADPH-dependent FMN reductase [Halorubrum sp. Ea1]